MMPQKCPKKYISGSALLRTPIRTVRPARNALGVLSVQSIDQFRALFLSFLPVFTTCALERVARKNKKAAQRIAVPLGYAFIAKIRSLSLPQLPYR